MASGLNKGEAERRTASFRACARAAKDPRRLAQYSAEALWQAVEPSPIALPWEASSMVAFASGDEDAPVRGIEFAEQPHDDSSGAAPERYRAAEPR